MYRNENNNRVDFFIYLYIYFFLFQFFVHADRQFWIENGKDRVIEKVKYQNKKGVAKNIIMFLGDGMSVTTLTASRIYKGQMEKRSGENEYLSFEKFPIVGMSKVR